MRTDYLLLVGDLLLTYWTKGEEVWATTLLTRRKWDGNGWVGSTSNQKSQHVTLVAKHSVSFPRWRSFSISLGLASAADKEGRVLFRMPRIKAATWRIDEWWSNAGPPTL